MREMNDGMAAWNLKLVRRSWLIAGLVLGTALAAPAQSGLLDQLTNSVTGPGTVENGCRQGNAKLCGSAGNMYRHGYQQAAKDLDKAIELYRLGCSGGDSASCQALYEIGFDDSRGKKVPLNMPRAVQLFTAGCDGSASGVYSGLACQELGNLYLKGKSVTKDAARGVQLLQRGCARSTRRACRDLGDVLLEGSAAPRDVPGAVAAYTKACSGKKPEARACMQLGLLYDEGKDVPRDVAAAEKYLTGGCTFPHRIGTACFELAKLYENDLPGKISEKQITNLYHVACDQADSDRVGEACVAAANRHLQGKGAANDPNWVSQLYSRGCQLKDEESCRLSCEFQCERGQPDACAAVKSGNYPLGVSNCYKP